MVRTSLVIALAGCFSLTSLMVLAEPIKVELGSPELTSGIPGEGPLTLAQIKAWLDRDDVHQEIEPALPFGLAAAQANVIVPKDNPMTKAKIELGRQLYFDTRLSSDNTISCASCHHPDDGFGRKTRFGVGVNGRGHLASQCEVAQRATIFPRDGIVARQLWGERIGLLTVVAHEFIGNRPMEGGKADRVQAVVEILLEENMPESVLR